MFMFMFILIKGLLKGLHSSPRCGRLHSENLKRQPDFAFLCEDSPRHSGYGSNSVVG